MAHAKRWTLPSAATTATARDLAVETNSPETVWRLLASRGITTVPEARAFLKPEISELKREDRDPFLLLGMEEAVVRLIAARDRGARIGIHGDYDVDGLTSTTLYATVLRNLGFTVSPFVPHRMIDGYGVSVRALEQFVEEGVGVVLTCDTGFSALGPVRHAVETLGLEVLVTDHHLGGTETPVAHALVNPNQAGDPYPFKGLCGVGVAFKVLLALVRRLGLDEVAVLYPYLDLVALGTVCDVMPLVDENRVFVSHGVTACRHTRNLGLQALLAAAGVEAAKVSEGTFGWILGPRLNAVGRIDDAGTGLRLLLATDPDEAKSLATAIEAWNTKRRELSKRIEQEALAMVETLDMQRTYGVALFAPDPPTEGAPAWHHGVIGIVASKVVERTGRPAFLFACDHETGAWKGSGRAPAASGAHLKDALDACDAHLAKHGGHAAAAGAQLRDGSPEGREAFAAAFNAAVAAQVSLDDLIPVIVADGRVGLDEINPDVYRKFFRRFAPFGAGNPEITFVAENATLTGVRPMGAEGIHARLTLEQHGVSHQAIAWSILRTHPWLSRAPRPLRVDLAFRVKEDVWRGETRLQLEVLDIRLHRPGVPADHPTAHLPALRDTADEPSQTLSAPVQDPAHAADRVHPSTLFR